MFREIIRIGHLLLLLGMFFGGPVVAQFVGTNVCRASFDTCASTCFVDNVCPNIAGMESCVSQCSFTLQDCIVGVIGEEKDAACLAEYGYCNEVCPATEVAAKSTCEQTCLINNTNADGSVDHNNYVSCYAGCSGAYPGCPTVPLCTADKQNEYAGCHQTCELNHLPAGFETDPNFDSQPYLNCHSACVLDNPYCTHTGPKGPWDPVDTDTMVDVDLDSDSDTDSNTDSNTDGTTTTGVFNVDVDLDVDVDIDSTSTGTGGIVNRTDTTGGDTTGGEDGNYCIAEYNGCNAECTREFIVNGVPTDLEAFANCGNSCDADFQTCQNIPNDCSSGHNACQNVCSTEYVFIPESCDGLAGEEEYESGYVKRDENGDVVDDFDPYDDDVTTAYESCLDRNETEFENTLIDKFKCIEACRDEFSMCVQEPPVYPKRPDLGPNSCTPIQLTRDKDDLKNLLIGGNGQGGGASMIPNTGPLTPEILERFRANTLFQDVSPFDVSYTPFATLALQGVIRGYDDGTVRPREVVTRAEMFKVLLHAKEELVYQGCGAYYDDVEPGSWYEPYINRAHELGFIYAQKPNANPAGHVKFGQFVLVMARAFGLADGLGDDEVKFQALLNEKQLLPIHLRMEDNYARFVTREDLIEVVYRYIQMKDTGAQSYLENLYLTIPDFNITQLPVQRSLISQPASWLPATLNGGAFYQDVNNGNLIMYGHASFQQETDPALTRFREVVVNMEPGQIMQLERDGILETYQVVSREVVSGLDVDALVNYGDADAVFFACNINPWERVMLKMDVVR